MANNAKKDQLLDQIKTQLHKITTRNNPSCSENMIQLGNLLEAYKEDIPHIMNQMLEQHDILALTLYAAMQKEDSIPKQYKDTWKQKLREIIIYTLQKKYAENPNLFLFKKKENGFHSLKEKDPKLLMFSIDIKEFIKLQWNYKDSWYEFILACCYVMSEIVEARNIIVVFALIFNHRIFNISSLREDFVRFDTSKKTPEEFLYDCNIPFPIICKFASRKVHICNYSPTPSKLSNRLVKEELMHFFQTHKEETEQAFKVLDDDVYYYINYLIFLYQEENGFNPIYLVNALTKKSKVVIEHAQKLLLTRENQSRAAVEELLKSKSKTTSDAALQIIRAWNKDKINNILYSLTDPKEVADCITQLFTKDNEKNVPYAKSNDTDKSQLNTIDYGRVHIKDSSEYMPASVMKYFISEHVLLKEIDFINSCQEISKHVDLYDLRNLLRQIYETWLEKEEKKFKNILFPYALYASVAQLDILKKQIDEWIENRKPGYATFAVQCIALNGTQMALLMVDHMSKKHKNKKIRRVAREALDLAMQKLDMTKNDFEDLLVPNFSFGKDRKRIFCYGERSFTALMGTDLSITLYDGDKIIRSLPKASEKYSDKVELAESAKEELKVIKKQSKLILDAGKLRMGKAIYSGRTWKKEKWETIFLENPIMFVFATGLVWNEFDSNQTLLGSFRYMEDGTLTTSEEEEYILHAGSLISLMHPAETEETIIKAFMSQLEDYEVKPPIEQFSLPIVDPALAESKIKEYIGKKIYGATIKSVATKFDCSLDFGDYGDCEGFICTFEENQIEFHTKVKSFYSGEYNAVVEIKDIYFTKREEGELSLDSVPKKLLSFAITIGDMLVAKQVND